MPLGKRKIIQPIPITLRHVQLMGIALHTPEDRLGRRISPNTNNNPLLPRFCPTCVAAGLTLRPTRTAYRRK
jgi:hypothetical protein